MSCDSVSPHPCKNIEPTTAVRDQEAEASRDIDTNSIIENVISNRTEKRENQWNIPELGEEFFCRVCDPVDEDLDEEAEEEAEAQRPLRDPGMPSRKEYIEHCLTHIPPRPWCPHCVKGKGKDTPSLKLVGQFAESLVPRIRLDYGFLTETADGEVEAHRAEDADEVIEKLEENSQTFLVMQESECKSVWSYAVEHKGASEEWAVHQICEDLETIGLKNDRIIVKDDQKPAIQDFARSIAKNRGGAFVRQFQDWRLGQQRHG